MSILKTSNYKSDYYSFSNLKISHLLCFFFSPRAQEIYKRHCEEKFVLDMLTFQKACERIQDAKTKVALVKTNLVLNVPSGMRE